MLELFDKGQLEHLEVGNKCFKSDNPECLGLIEMVFSQSAYFRVRWLGIHYGHNDYPFEMVYDFNFMKGSRLLAMDQVVNYHKKMNFFNRDIYLDKEIQVGIQTESKIIERMKELKNEYVTYDQVCWQSHVKEMNYEKQDLWFDHEVDKVIEGSTAFELERVLHKMGLIDWFGKPERVKRQWKLHMLYLIDRLAFNRLVIGAENLKGYRVCMDLDNDKAKLKHYHKDPQRVLKAADYFNSDTSMVMEKRVCKRRKLLAIDLLDPNKLNDSFIAF